MKYISPFFPILFLDENQEQTKSKHWNKKKNRREKKEKGNPVEANIVSNLSGLISIEI